MSVIGSPIVLEPRKVGFSAPATSQAPSLARRWAAQALAEWNLSLDQDVALLVLSELVTNAVIHGADPHAGRHSEIRVELVEIVNGLHMKVHDPDQGEASIVALRHAVNESESGRGLELVEALSAKWWCEQTLGGKDVHVILAREVGSCT